MSILKSILHRYNTTSQNYDTLHPETEHAQVTDFGNGVLAHLLDSTLVSAVTAVSTGSLFGKLVEKLLEASGVQYNFQNSNAWYICLGSLFGGLIIQGGRKTYNPTDGDDGTEGTFPIEFNQNCKSIYASYPYQQNHIVAAGFDDNTTFRIWAKNCGGTRISATVAYIAYGI